MKAMKATMAEKIIVWTCLFLINGVSITLAEIGSIDAVLEVAVNGTANCTTDNTKRMFEDEVNELLFELDCMFNVTFNATDRSALSCEGDIYSANVSVVKSMDTLQPDVCHVMNCLYGLSNVTGTHFFNDELVSVRLLTTNGSLCNHMVDVTGSPSNTTSELLSVFIRDLIIVAASTGGGSAVILTAIVIIVFCVKTVRYSYRKSRSWTLSNSDMDAQNFVPYNPDIDDTSKSIPMGRVREGPLPTPPPPDTPRPSTERYVHVQPVHSSPTVPGNESGGIPLSSLVPGPPAPPPPMPTPGNPALSVVGGAAPPPPPPLPPITTSQPSNSKSLATKNYTGSSSNSAMLPPISNPMTLHTQSSPPHTTDEQLASTNFVEDIYDVYDVDEEVDLHQKTKELENLLASMDASQYIDPDSTDEYIEVNPAPRRASNSAATLPDYVNFNPAAHTNVLGDDDNLPHDEYVDMASSLRRDQQLINYTSNEDMYI